MQKEASTIRALNFQRYCIIMLIVQRGKGMHITAGIEHATETRSWPSDWMAMTFLANSFSDTFLFSRAATR